MSDAILAFLDSYCNEVVVNTNDVFGPAGDCQSVEIGDLPKLLDAASLFGASGVMAVCSRIDGRGAVPWRPEHYHRFKEAMEWLGDWKPEWEVIRDKLDRENPTPDAQPEKK